MRILSKESFTAIQPLLPENYANLSSRLSLKLPPKVAASFAKFTMLPAHNMGQWSVEGEGEEEYRPFSQATPSERQKAAHAMRLFTDALKKAGLNYDINRLLAVPDENCIFYRICPDGSAAILLTQWGFRRIGGGKPIDVIDVLIGNGGKEEERTDVNIRLRWSDGTPLAGVPVTVTVYGEKTEYHTSAEGTVSLGSVAVGERFTVDTEGQETAMLRTDGENHEYLVVYPWYVDATVRCLDSAHMPKKARLQIDGKEMDTDDNGILTVNGIELHEEQKLAVSLGGAHEQKFPLHHESRDNNFEYVLPKIKEVVPPEDKNKDSNGPVLESAPRVTIHVVDKKNRPMAFARVRVKFERGVKEAVTDSQGYLKLERSAFTQGEKVRIEVLPGSVNQAVAQQVPVNPPVPGVRTPVAPQGTSVKSVTPPVPRHPAGSTPKTPPVPGSGDTTVLPPVPNKK